MDSRHYWDETSYIKYENYNSNDEYSRVCDGNLNFSIGAPPSEDETDYTSSGYLKKGKIARQDPLSHRIIEKRRRDRMNNCLADLSRLIPPEYLKKGRGRIEKTEIIEMAIKHLKYLKEKTRAPEPQEGPISLEHFRLGYQECLSEVMRYLVEHQGHSPSDGFCLQIVHHLQRHCEKITKSDQINKPRSSPETTSSSSGSSSNYMPNQTVIAQNTLRSEAKDAEEYRSRDTDSESPNASLQPSSVDFCTSAQLSDKEHKDRAEEPLPAYSPNLRDVRKAYSPDDTIASMGVADQDNVHSYKFKNTIQQRFSESQEANFPVGATKRDQMISNGKTFKRRRVVNRAGNDQSFYKGQTSSTSLSSSDNAMNLSQESQGYSRSNDDVIEVPSEPRYKSLDYYNGDVVPKNKHNMMEKYYKSPDAKSPGISVPIFALHAKGAFYVPLNIEYEYLVPFLGPYDLLNVTGVNSDTSLHPVTISVNFQPSLFVNKKAPNAKPKTEGAEWH